jgi:SAM-dependent methyltransferase
VPTRARIEDLLGVPPAGMRPWALPGAPTYHERRFARRVARAPVMTGEQHAASVGMRELEQVIACTLCGEPRMQPLFDPQHPSGRWSYHVVRCPSCGLLYRHPGIVPERLGELYTVLYRHPGIVPERLGELYTERYGAFLLGKYAKKRRRRYRLVLKAFHPLFADGTGRRLLDFGCGAGLFLDIAHRRGFEGYGVDLSEDAIAQARARPYGQRTWVGAPRDVPEVAAGGFDVVTLWSVLAHLATPVEDLSTLRGLLKPDGVLLALTVNANSLALKADGSAWNGFTPTHLTFYAPDTLRALLRKAGFAAVTIRPAFVDTVDAGTTSLRGPWLRQYKRSVVRGNRGNMLRAVAWADAATPARWGLEAERL